MENKIFENVQKYVSFCVGGYYEDVTLDEIGEILEEKLQELIDTYLFSYHLFYKGIEDEKEDHFKYMLKCDMGVDDFGFDLYELVEDVKSDTVTYNDLIEVCGWSDEKVQEYLNDYKNEEIKGYFESK